MNVHVLQNALQSQTSKGHQIVNSCPITVNHTTLSQVLPELVTIKYKSPSHFNYGIVEFYLTDESLEIDEQ
jgi:hypothetical protein